MKNYNAIQQTYIYNGKKYKGIPPDYVWQKYIYDNKFYYGIPAQQNILTPKQNIFQTPQQNILAHKQNIFQTPQQNILAPKQNIFYQTPQQNIDQNFQIHGNQIKLQKKSSIQKKLLNNQQTNYYNKNSECGQKCDNAICNINECNKCNKIIYSNNNNKKCNYLSCGSFNCAFKFSINTIDYVFKITKIENNLNEDDFYFTYNNILNKHILFDNLIYYKSNRYAIKNLDNIDINNIPIFNDIIKNINDDFKTNFLLNKSIKINKILNMDVNDFFNQKDIINNIELKLKNILLYLLDSITQLCYFKFKFNGFNGFNYSDFKIDNVLFNYNNKDGTRNMFKIIDYSLDTFTPFNNFFLYMYYDNYHNVRYYDNYETDPRNIVNSDIIYNSCYYDFNCLLFSLHYIFYQYNPIYIESYYKLLYNYIYIKKNDDELNKFINFILNINNDDLKIINSNSNSNLFYYYKQIIYIVDYIINKIYNIDNKVNDLHMNLKIKKNNSKSIILNFRKIDDEDAKLFLNEIYTIVLYTYGSKSLMNNSNEYNIGIELINEIYNNLNKIDKNIVNILYNNINNSINDTEKIMRNYNNIYNIYLFVINNYNMDMDIDIDIDILDEIFFVSKNNNNNILLEKKNIYFNNNFYKNLDINKLNNYIIKKQKIFNYLSNEKTQIVEYLNNNIQHIKKFKSIENIKLFLDDLDYYLNNNLIYKQNFLTYIIMDKKNIELLLNNLLILLIKLINEKCNNTDNINNIDMIFNNCKIKNNFEIFNIFDIIYQTLLVINNIYNKIDIYNNTVYIQKINLDLIYNDFKLYIQKLIIKLKSILKN